MIYCPHCTQPYFVEPGQWVTYHGKTVHCTRCGKDILITAQAVDLAQAVNLETQPQPFNGWALASLISAIVLFCIPVLGGLLGIVLGILGLRSARACGGRRVAIAGVALATASLVLTTLAILMVAAGLRVQSHHTVIGPAPSDSLAKLKE